jgi:opacity protein-like surface antigen
VSHRFALWLSPLLLAFGVVGAAAADLNRTEIGPGGADFSGIEIGPDLGVALGTAGSTNISGPAGGAHVGYNFQANRVVGGVEGDVTFGSIRSGSLGSASFSQDLLSSARVKGGYVFGNLLAYGTIGWGWSTTDYKYLGGSSGQTVKGLAYGVGAEYPITRNVSIRGELLRYDFGSATYTFPTATPSVSTSTNVARIGASLHF